MYTTVYIARYSFIQLSELWQREVIKLAKGSKRPQWHLKAGSLKSGLLTGIQSRRITTAMSPGLLVFRVGRSLKFPISPSKTDSITHSKNYIDFFNIIKINIL